MARQHSNPSSRGNMPQRAVAQAGERAFRFRFFVETFGELKRVTWPSREQVIRLTMLVLTVSAVIGLFLGLVDWLFSQVTRILFL